VEAPCFMKNASASGSSKSQMLPSSLPLPASFFKVLPLPQKFNRFQLPLPHPWFQLYNHYVIMLRHHRLNHWICDAEERGFERGWYGLMQRIYWQVPCVRI